MNRNMRSHLKNLLETYQLDILHLTETHGGLLPGLLVENPQYCIMGSPGESNSRGSVFVIKRNGIIDTLQCKEALQLGNFETGRFTCLKVYFKNPKLPKLTICGVYAPNLGSERRSFFIEMSNHLLDKQIDLLMGDFNCVINSKDRRNQAITSEAGASQLESLIEINALSDVYDSTEYETAPMSHFQGCGSSRIDRIYIRNEYSHRLRNVETIHTGLSDHAMIGIDLQITVKQTGRSTWRLNVALLPEMNNIVNEALTAASKYTLSPMAKWCKIKEEITKKAQKLGKKKQKLAITRLKRQIKQFSRELNEPEANEDNIHEQLGKLRKEWDNLSERNKRVAQYRWRSLGEKSTRYNFLKAKSQKIRYGIYGLKAADGIIKDNHEEMAELVTKFYQDLYTPEPIDEASQQELLETLRQEYQGKKVNIFENCMLTKSIEHQEITAIIKTMARNKSPGPDGLPIELYQMYPNLTKYLLEALNEFIETKKAPASFTEGSITLLYKKNDPLLLKNYRPISLLNSDYKILTKVLATRLNEALSEKLSEDQHAFLKDRFIHDNIMEIKLLINLVNRTEGEGFLAFLDQEKAYDRVDHDLLWKTLKVIGIEDRFINIIKGLYSDAQSNILLNGTRSGTIKCQRGVRQGDPLSCILYVCIMEILKAHLESKQEIQTIETQGMEATKVKMYADDTVVAARDETSLKNLFHQLQVYEKGTGAKFNVEKTEILPLGKTPEEPIPGLDLKITTEGNMIRHIGCPVGNNPNTAEVWRTIENKMVRIRDELRIQNQTIKGKALIMQSLVGSQIWFLANHIKLPKRQMDSFETILKKGVFPERVRVKYDIIALPTKEGGLGMPSVRAKIQCIHLKWITRFVEKKHLKWGQYLLEHFRLSAHEMKHPEITITDPFVQNLKNVRFSNLPGVWLDAWNTWKGMQGCIDTEKMHELSSNELRSLPLWKMDKFNIGLSRANEGANMLKTSTNAMKLEDVLSPSGKRLRVLDDTDNTPRKRKKQKNTLDVLWKKMTSTPRFRRTLHRHQESSRTKTQSEILKVTLNGKEFNTMNQMQEIYRELCLQRLNRRNSDSKETLKSVICTPENSSLHKESLIMKSLWNTRVPHRWTEMTYLAALERHMLLSRIGEDAREKRCKCLMGPPETHKHLFFKCKVSIPVWELVIRTWKIYANLPKQGTVSVQHSILKYGWAQKWEQKEKQPRQTWKQLYCATMRAIWLSRNQAVFDRSAYTTEIVIATLKRQLKELLELEKLGNINSRDKAEEKKWKSIIEILTEEWTLRHISCASITNNT